MFSSVVPYEPPHPHLLYTFGLTLLCWIGLAWYCRRVLHSHPGACVVLQSFLILLPLYSEVGSRLLDAIRPAPDTPVGYMLTHFHAYVINRVPIDSFLSPKVEHMLVLLLMLVALLSLVRVAYGHCRLRQYVASATLLRANGRAAVEARLHEQIAPSRSLRPVMVIDEQAPAAFTTGIIRPRIYVSRRLAEILSDDELLAVLCHEYAHIQRRDNLWNVFVRVVRDMLVFLPAAHLAWSSMVQSQDEACDDLAARIMGNPLSVARALVRIAASWNDIDVPNWPVAVPFARPSQGLQRRVERMVHLHGATTQRAQLPRSVFLVAAMMIVLGVLPALIGS